MVVVGQGKPITAAARRAAALGKIRRRRSRIALSVIILVSIVVPVCVTLLLIGSDRAQGYAVLGLALLFVVIGFLPLFQRPLPKSLQSPNTPPSDGGAAGFHGY